MNRMDYAFQKWREFRAEARRGGVLAVNDYSGQRLAEHMYWADQRTVPPWEDPELIGQDVERQGAGG